MSVHLQRDLERVQRRIVAMASTVEQAVEQAIVALFNRDASMAAALVGGEDAIDAEENEIEESCLKILALHQPAAIDLRRVIAILKINSELERMGDLVVNIAERVHQIALTPNVRVPVTFRHMADLTNSMVRQSLDAFVQLDAVLAKRVCRSDDQVDQMNREIIKQIIVYMTESPENVELGLHLFSVSRHIERIADHATNIAEVVVYLIEGTIIRHHPEALK